MQEAEVRGAVLSRTRPTAAAALLLVRAQCVPAQSAADALTLVAPGVPEASSAYELTPNGVSPLRHNRVAGGVSVSLDDFGLAAQVLLAQDPLIIGAVHRRAAQAGRRAAELAAQPGRSQVHTVEALAGQLAARTPVRSLRVARCGAARACNRASQPARAISRRRPERPAGAAALRLVERAYWDAARKGWSRSVTSPAALGFDTLPCHWRLMDRLRGARFSQNLMAGGDFEDLGTMLRAGWQYIYQAAPGVQGAVDLAPQAAHSGRLGLRLSVRPLDPKNPPAAIENPPVLFTSPAVQVAAGQIVCIHGWVQVPEPITAAADGLLVVDSISGEALADRIQRDQGLAGVRRVSRGDPVGAGLRHLRPVRHRRGLARRRGNRSRGRPLIADRQWFYPLPPVIGNVPGHSAHDPLPAVQVPLDLLGLRHLAEVGRFGGGLRRDGRLDADGRGLRAVEPAPL